MNNVESLNQIGLKLRAVLAARAAGDRRLQGAAFSCFLAFPRLILSRDITFYISLFSYWQIDISSNYVIKLLPKQTSNASTESSGQDGVTRKPRNCSTSLYSFLSDTGRRVTSLPRGLILRGRTAESGELPAADPYSVL